MSPISDDSGDLAGPRPWPRLSAEDRFARVVAGWPTALILVGAGGLIEIINTEAERMFGYDRHELAARPLEMLLPERLRREHVDLREALMIAPSTRGLAGDRDLFGLRKDGTEFPLEIGLDPIELDGQTMVLAGMTDITVRRAIELEQEEQRTELVRSNADLEEFAYVASHDLKAPLRAISHLVDWIAEDIEATASPETIDNLKLLRGRVVRLQSLLDGLLSYARVGQSRTSFENVDVAGVVRDVVSALSPPPGFVVECDENTPLLYTHRASIMIVLQNLIGNAIKHHDREQGHITVSMQLRNGIAEFRVADDGPGIAPRFHDRIFVIFQTLSSRDDVEASGIGLAIVKKRVEGHGGHIRVESEPPARGTTFVFTWKEAVQ